MKDRVLIVDDIDINRIVLKEILARDYEIVEAESGIQALEYLASGSPRPQAILLDIIMPGMSGYEVLEHIKANPSLKDIPVLFITAVDASSHESRGLKCGAADFISKPYNADVIKMRLENQIQLCRYHAGLEDMVRQKTSSLMKVHEHILETMAALIEYRSLESSDHIRRCVELTRVLVQYLLPHPELGRQLREMDYHAMIEAASLHDIGKMGISDSILLKPGSLTSEEYEVVKTHTVIGHQIIAHITASVPGGTAYLSHCSDICRHHHERWDGLGYPDGLRGEAIPLSARIVAVVDVYDALVNTRCYKPAYTHEEAVCMLWEGRGTQFDPRVVDAALCAQDKFQEIQVRHQNNCPSPVNVAKQ